MQLRTIVLFDGQNLYHLRPAVHLAGVIAKGQGRDVAFESCFPYGAGSLSDRGIPGTTWVKIDQNLYDRCLDPKDYR